MDNRELGYHKLETLHFPDDFEEFRARASSGGSLYGIFRRQVIASTSTIPNFDSHMGSNSVGNSVHNDTGLPKPFKRQRSRSLITRNSGLTDEKYILLALYDYAEAQRHKQEVRRHSTAIDGRDLRRVVLTNSLNKSLNTTTKNADVLLPYNASSVKPLENTIPPQDSNFLSPESIFSPPPETRKNSIHIPPPSRKNSTCLVIPSPSRSRKNSLVIDITPPSRKNSIAIPENSVVQDFDSILSQQQIPQPPPSTLGVLPLQPSIGTTPPRKYSLPKLMITDTDADDEMSTDDLLMPPPDAVPIQRRRSFTITAGGVKNQGDILIPILGQPGGPIISKPPTPEPYDPYEFEEPQTSGDVILQVPNLVNKQPPMSRTNSVGEMSDSGDSAPGGHKTDTSDSATASDGWEDIPCYRVLMLGGPGVGKTALTQQFMTSEYMAAQNTSFDDGIECPVPVLLDGEEYIMEFVDLPYTGNPSIWKDYEVDAYVVVFSITDRRSLQKADDYVYSIRKEGHTEEAVILVANKTDLVRSRLVSEEEARLLADGFGCKFIEVSAILNHKVDDLLVGILKQIRLSLDGPDEEDIEPVKSKECADDSACLTQARQTMFGKFFKPRLTRSCENLLTL